MHSFDPDTRADCRQLIRMAFTEDVGSPHPSTAICCTSDAIIPRAARARAAFVSRAAGIVCGIQATRLVIEEFASELDLEVLVADGEAVDAGQNIAVVSGPAHQILVCERTCLNFMGRLSGISSLTRRFVEAVANPAVSILDTRKTLPGWRRLEKYAVACGGGQNHRMGLYDAVMIKDNHLAFFQTVVSHPDQVIPEAIQRARQWIADNADRLTQAERTPVIIEVDDLRQFNLALAAEPDIILLDNMTPEQLRQAADIRSRTGGSVLLEASGGVTLDTIRTIGQTGVDRISVGALTHSAVNFDIGLDWQIEP